MATIRSARNSALPVDDLPINDLLIAMGYAIRENDDLLSWCMANYGQPVTVFSGSDPDNPPDVSSYPLVELVPLTDNMGREIERHERVIGMVCGLFNTNAEPLVMSGMTIIQGVLHLEEFYRLALTAAAGADLSGGYVARVEAMRDQETLFPYYLLGAEITIVKPI